MKNLPQIEWPEQHEPNEEARIAKLIIDVFKLELFKRFDKQNCIYLISPSPARNIEELNKALLGIDALNHGSDTLQPIQYGYKERGNGFVFNKLSTLAFLLPVFFHHGAENLIIAGINNVHNIQDNESALSKLIAEIMLGADKTSQSGYLGLLFDCNSLVQIFDNEISVE